MRMASTSYSAWLATTCSAVWSSPSPTMYGCVVLRQARQRSAATPRRATARSRGMSIGASSRGSRPPRRGSIFAMWELASPMAAPNGSTTASTARGQAENLIKLHKCQLASDRTSCRSALANQVRLVLHTAAYWLMLSVRDAIPNPQPLAVAEFATLRARLLKIAARITETATRVRIAFAAACPEAELFRYIAYSRQPAAP